MQNDIKEILKELDSRIKNMKTLCEVTVKSKQHFEGKLAGLAEFKRWIMKKYGRFDENN